LHALRQFGVNAYSEFKNGCPPVMIEAQGLRGGSVRVKGDLSSQFLSGLLMAAPLADGDVVIDLTGPLVSEPYVVMTVEMMRRAGIKVQDHPAGHYSIPGRQAYSRYHFDIEADASAASYFFGAAAVSGGKVTVGTAIEDPRMASLQGDYQFLDLLERMGCRVQRKGYSVTVHGHRLRGIDTDMNAISDTVMTLAAVACFAGGPTTIRNVAHIRHKETDRLAALATELRRVGARVEEFADGLTITPRPLHGAEIETYNDHRMAMSLALIGLRVPGIVIKNPGCVAKTYPGFWDDLERLRA
jgi:3-phosphoshikimate 1-carboxyvinyltransferase